jgi:hypothetical protein
MVKVDGDQRFYDRREHWVWVLDFSLLTCQDAFILITENLNILKRLV